MKELEHLRKSFTSRERCEIEFWNQVPSCAKYNVNYYEANGIIARISFTSDQEYVCVAFFTRVNGYGAIVDYKENKYDNIFCDMDAVVDHILSVFELR